MPTLWMNVDAALTEVPVNIIALIDDADFKTRMESITYDQAGMDLVWNFVSTAGVFTQTAVTPTTGGDYDWVNQGNGMYTIEIPSSGGASINNDTEGFGWFTGYATGVLPWRGSTIGFRAAAINDALIDGGDVLDTNTTQWNGDTVATPTVGGVPEVDVTHMAGGTQTVTDLKDFADEGYDPGTNKVQGVVLTDTCTTNSDMRGTDSALLAASLNISGGIVESNVQKVEDKTLSGKTGDNFDYFFQNDGGDTTKIVDNVGSDAWDPDTDIVDGTITWTNAMRQILSVMSGKRTLDSNNQITYLRRDNSTTEVVLKKDDNVVTRESG